MKLFLLKPTFEIPAYDAVRSVVIAAETEAAARRMVRCGTECGCESEGPCVWTNPALVEATMIGVAAEGVDRGTVCRDFAAG